MARIRTIKPEFWTSEQVADCSPISRLLFIGMWNFCDDGGNHPASCRTLKMQIFPGDDFTTADIEGQVSELVRAGLLVEYEAAGKRYWHVTGWKHQKIEKPSYKYPPPIFEQSANHPRHVADDSANSRRQLADDQPAEGNGREWNGEESNKPPVVPLPGEHAEQDVSLMGEGDVQQDAESGKTQELPAKTQEQDSQAQEQDQQPADKRTRGTQIPKGYEPTGAHIVMASELGVNLSEEFQSFRDYHTAKGSVFKDWDAALRTWIRNAKKFARSPTATNRQKSGVMHTGINQQDFSDVPEVNNLGI